ncbi:hypothetical protein [Thermococcus sp. 21S9]|uniref:hypothetical protein n=1 Tax=Thermococcus sp. 21S9 TaxID=1638223 RepID=UPI001439FF8F|nr:hypothetical protein [Thermococcus sp. 21S9]NJE55454.1 hypothetical protein [Thermococcus sp. 21S9]
MAISSTAVYLMISAIIPMFYAQWVDWPSEIIKKPEPYYYELQDALNRSLKYIVAMGLGLSLFSLGMTLIVPIIGYLFWGATGIVLMWLRHGREQLKLKLQEIMMKEAIAKGVEIGMKKARET